MSAKSKSGVAKGVFRLSGCKENIITYHELSTLNHKSREHEAMAL
jgi:hypothetical protein